MISLKVKLTGDKKSLGTAGEDTIIELHPKFLQVSLDFIEREYKDEHDEKLGTKDVVVSEVSLYKKESIGQVSAAWWDEGQVWFVKISGSFSDSININMCSKEQAMHVSETIKKWLFEE